MIFQFGEIKFEILNAPTNMRVQERMNFVPIERIKGKPVIQELGRPLTTISMEITLSYQFADVPLSIARLRGAMSASEEKELIDGTGHSYGVFKIESVEQDILKTDSVGRVIYATLGLELIEYAPYDQEQDAKVKARQAAFARIEARPLEVNVRPLQVTPQAIMSNKIVIGATATKAGIANLKKADSIPSLANKYLTTAQRQLKTGADAIKGARAEVDSVVGVVSNVNQLRTSLDNVISTFDTLLPNLTTVTPESLPGIIAGSASTLENQMRSLNSVASVLTAVTSIRK